MRFVGLALLLIASVSGRAEAVFTITFTQVGSDVLASGSGSIQLNASSSPVTGTFSGGYVVPNSGVAVLGSGSSVAYSVVLDRNFTFGSGTPVFATSNSGSAVGFDADEGFIFIPSNYISGTQLSSSDTFAHQSIASLGLNVGTTTLSFSRIAGAPVADSFVIQVLAPASVPEPSSLAMLGIAATVGLGYRQFRRRRLA